jgi:DNA-binding CsgD family transcriptional regulator
VYRRRVPSVIGGLLERERELETLHEGLARACAGEGMLVLIEGPAGVGKTELEREVRAAAERAGMTALAARGSELEQPFAFGVVRQLLEPVMSSSLWSADVFDGAARPAARLFEQDAGAPAPGDVGFEALHSLYWLVVNIADGGPLLVLVDDCQWADRDSLRFLVYLAQRIEGLSVAMVLAGRVPDSAETESAALWSQLASRPSAVALYPRPLTAAAVVALAQESLGPDAHEEFCRACHTATGGNPLFVRELLRGLAAAGVVPSASASSEVQSVGPAAVRRFVLHRLAALGPAATELAQVVAVLGDDSELRLSARVADLSEATARDVADDLVRADIFARGERLGFVHPIVRAALYEELAPGERHARHAAVAQALAHAGASPERISAHLMLTTATGDRDRVQILRSAAVEAAHRGAPSAAAARLRRALAESPPEHERATILADLGRYELAAMQFDAAERHLRDCLSSGGELTTRADAASTLGRCAIVSGGHSAEMAVDALASLAEEMRPLDRERSLELGSELLMVATAVLRLRDRVVKQLPEFREQARGHPGFEALARILGAGEELVAGGSAAVAVEEVLGALAAGLPPGAQTNAAFLALLLLVWGEQYDVALRALDAALDRARREGSATRQGIIHGQRAAIALAQGSLHDAQVEAETGLLLVEKPHFAVLQLVAVAIVVHIERGALADALELARTGEALGIADDRNYVPEFLIARGRLQTAQGHVREGVADLLRCGESRESRGVLWPNDWKAYAAAGLASLDEHQTASRLAREQLDMARRVGASGALGLSLRAAALAAQGEERLALLTEAVSVLEPSAARLELAHALVELGCELSRAGQRREGRDVQRRAIKLADECGAVALAERARAELHSGPGRRPRAELTGRNALTAAEWRVCRQAASGRTNREIAQALFVTEKTIERHLSNVYQKLAIHSRFQLSAAIAE